MGLQINSQPQNFLGNVVIGNGLSAVDGLTVYGSISSTNSISSQSISGSFYGDGSKLTGISSGVTSVNGLTGAVTGVALTGASVSFSSVSGTFYGDANNLTGLVHTDKDSTITGQLTINPNITGGLITTKINNDTNQTLTVISNLLVNGSISALSGISYTSTNFNTVTALSVDNTGALSNTATLYVRNAGAGAVAEFWDKDLNSELLHIGGNNLGSIWFPYNNTKIGVNIPISNLPSKTLTISGDISASSDAWFGSNIYSNNVNINSLYASKNSFDQLNSSLNASSANWNIAYNQLSSGKLSSSIDGFTVNVSLSTPSLTANTGLFNISLSAPSISGVFYGDGSKLTGVASSNVLYTSGGTITGSGGLNSPSLSAQTLTANNATIINLSSSSISGVFYGDGSKLTGVASSNVLYTSGGTITGSGGLSSPFLSAQTLTANTGLFNVSLSSPSISGIHYGDGSKLTGVIPTNILFTSGGTITGTGGLNSPFLSAQTLTANTGLFNTSISAKAVSGVFYGDGSKLNSIVTSINGLTGTVTNVLFTSGGTITGSGGLNTPVLSTQSLTASTFTLSGYPINPVSVIYNAGTGATANYTISLADNNRTLTMNVTNSGQIIIPLSVTFPTGFQFNVIQLGTGRITLSADLGILLYNDLSAYRTYKQFSAATVTNLGDIWVAYGSLSA